MKKAGFAFGWALASLLAQAPAQAQPQFSTNDVVFKSGHWHVVRSVRPRSGIVACTGFYHEERDVQLSKDSLIAKVPGDLRQVVVRFGDELSQPARAPTAAEKQLDAVVLSGEAFNKLQGSRKLALEVTYRDARGKEERKAIVLRMQGIKEALANIAAGCPVPREAVVTCSQPLLARMQAAGLTAAQVQKICR